jgi:hypothetical protein
MVPVNRTSSPVLLSCATATWRPERAVTKVTAGAGPTPAVRLVNDCALRRCTAFHGEKAVHTESGHFGAVRVRASLCNQAAVGPPPGARAASRQLQWAAMSTDRSASPCTTRP